MQKMQKMQKIEKMEKLQKIGKGYRIDRLRIEGERLIEVAAGNLEAAVATCPGWDNQRLLGHTARVWAAMALQVGRRATQMLPRTDVPRPGDEGVVAFARGRLNALVAALADVDEAEPLWSWGAEQSAAFYLRRAHQETLVHRVDAELTAGAVTPVPAVDAVDGLDELFGVMYRPDAPAPADSLHVHRTDGDGEWMLQARSGGGVDVRREHAKGAAALRGRAEELLLVMWGRRGRDDLESFGSPAVIDAWVALAP